jgi:large subunit ribosomal protein L21
MTKYAIVSLAGKQYKIQEGDEFVVDKLDHQAGDSFETDQVFLVNNDGKIAVGNPLVKGSLVKFKVLIQQKSKKLRVSKFKAKSRYRRVYGHRQHQSIVQVTSIN